MSISRDPMQIYRDSVLVKQQQMLNELDNEYDRYVTEIRNQQKEMQKQIKLLFYKEIDGIDSARNDQHNMNSDTITNNDLYPEKGVKSIKMDIYQLPSNDSNYDSEDIPILGENHCKQTANTNIDTTNITRYTQQQNKSENDQNNDIRLPSLSIPPLPPLPSIKQETKLILPPIPNDFIIPKKHITPNTLSSAELSSILALMAANHKTNKTNTIKDMTPSITMSLTPIPPLPMIPPLPPLSALMKENKNDTLITMKYDMKCNKIPFIKDNMPDLPPLPALFMKAEDKKDHKSSEFDGKILLENIPLIERVNISETSIIHKTSDCTKWKCDFCRKWIKYTSDRDVFNHLLEHRRERKFKCDYCAKVFKRRSDVKRHSRTHTGERPHKCDQCGKGFGTKYCLKTHIRTHTGDKPYECHFCGKSFRQNSHLTVHWRTHTGDKPYECKTCNKRFSQHSTLAVHYRIHNGNKPFVCPCCDRPFTQRHSLQRHIKNVHKDYFNECGVDHIYNLHNLQKAKEKELQNNMAKADKFMKDLL